MSSDTYTAPRSENLLKFSQGLALRHLSKIVARNKVILRPRRYVAGPNISAPLLPKNDAAPLLDPLFMGLEPSLVNNNLAIYNIIQFLLQSSFTHSSITCILTVQRDRES